MASARATATRWRMPPDSSAGLRSAAWPSPTMLDVAVDALAALGRGLPANTASTASATLPRTDSHGISE